jgi:hypothetical protein
MSRRIDIEADDVPELLDKPGVLRQLEGVDAMRLQAMRLPDALHGRGTDPNRFGHHPKRPVGRLARRISHGQIDYALDRCRGRGRLSRLSGLIAKKSVDALSHEPLLPPPDHRLG